MRDVDQPIPILGLDSADDLDPQFRPGGGFIARGPFRVYSPDWDHWEFGYDLEQVGPHLLFQDGEGVGRSIPVDDYLRTASDKGSKIWFQGILDDELSTFLLMPATLEDFQGHVGQANIFASWDDGAAVVRHMLETARWKSFGIAREEPLITRIGLVCWVDKTLPVIGMYKAERGQLFRRGEERWQRVDEREQPWAAPGAPEALWFPVLHGVEARYSSMIGYDALTLNSVQLNRFVFPQILLTSPSTWVDKVEQSFDPYA